MPPFRFRSLMVAGAGLAGAAAAGPNPLAVRPLGLRSSIVAEFQTMRALPLALLIIVGAGSLARAAGGVAEPPSGRPVAPVAPPATSSLGAAPGTSVGAPTGQSLGAAPGTSLGGSAASSQSLGAAPGTSIGPRHP